MKLAPAVAIVSLLVGGAVGYSIAQPDATEALPPGVPETEAAESPELLALREEIADLRRREAELLDQFTRLETPAPVVASEPEDAPAGEDTAPGATELISAAERELLTDVSDANRIAADLLARHDIEGLWLLAADLLAFGDEGYDKLLELGRWIESNQDQFQGFEHLWRSEEVMAGRFLRAMHEHHEELLRFGLHLDTLDEGARTKVFGELHEELHDELGVIILGYYQGDDPEILDGYVEMFGRQLAGDLDGRHQVDRIRALGQIPTEASTDLLIELLDRAPEGSRARTDAVRALAWQGSERALPTLRSLLETTEDPRLIPIIEAAIRYLE